MDIKILDSHLREFLKTKAKPRDIAHALSLMSASIEKIEEFKKDYLYHIEVTTNRADLSCVTGIAREATAVLPQFDFTAACKEVSLLKKPPVTKKETIHIVNNDKLVKRICAVILEVTQKESPHYIKDRLEAAGIRSLNNLIDITNYVMLEIGHPTHAFDYDRLTSKKLLIREAKKGEKIVTLDKKEYILLGGDIVADNGKGEIVDLLGVMGTWNSVVREHTKRIVFFIDNNDPARIRKTSMSLGIRTEAATLNEKDVDPERAMTALLRGIQLYQETADAKIVSDIIDIYPHPYVPKTIIVSQEKINKVIGVSIPLKKAADMLSRLGFTIKQGNNQIKVTVPSWRAKDVEIAEDVIEEIARMYGYHNLPSKIPVTEAIIPHPFADEFYWEQRVKEGLKYWGFSEVYTYSMVSETLLDGPIENAVTLKNPLDEEHVYMRRTLTPSLLQVLHENKKREKVQIFEIANVYHKKSHGLPEEIQMLAGVIKGSDTTFYYAKGIIEQIISDLGIPNLRFQNLAKGGLGADVYLDKQRLGEIEVLEENLVTFEINCEEMVKYATLKKTYTPLAKYPPIIEDIALFVDQKIQTGDIIDEIKKQSNLIVGVSLLDQYEDKRTFHVVYQNAEKNLTNEEVGKVREKIITAVEKKFKAKVK